MKILKYIFPLLAFIMAACGTDGTSALVSMIDEPAGTNCSSGGLKLQTGFDSNSNGVLDTSEVKAVKYICSGKSGAAGQDGINGTDGTNGTKGAKGDAASPCIIEEDIDGSSTLTCPGSASVTISKGDKGETGDKGSAGAAGTDAQNCTSSANEDGSTTITCGGIEITVNNGEKGADGANGTDALETLIKITHLSPAPGCSGDGDKVEAGADLNANTTLDNNEITSTSYICDGANGTDGKNSVVKITEENPGKECPAGGILIQTGFDTNGNNILDGDEAATEDYVCNGEKGDKGDKGETGDKGTAGEDAKCGGNHAPVIKSIELETSEYGYYRIDTSYSLTIKAADEDDNELAINFIGTGGEIVSAGGIGEYTVTPRMTGRNFSIVIVVSDGCQMATSSFEVPVVENDKTPPQIFDTAIGIWNLKANSFSASWTPAGDNLTPPERLQYKVVISTTASDLDSIETIEAGGGDMIIVQDWTAGLTEVGVASLSDSTGYWLAVEVRDDFNNKSLYALSIVTTLDATVPVYDGDLNVNDITDTTLNLRWTKAADNITPRADLEYKIVKALSASDIDSISKIDAISGDDLLLDWTADINSYDVTGLDNNRTFYFNVLVRDKAHNMTMYTTVEAKTLDSAPSDVTGLDAVSNGTDIKLIWKDPAQWDFDHVEITWTPEAPEAAFTVTKGLNEYTVTGLDPDTEYTFTLTSFDAGGKKSAGAVIKATPFFGIMREVPAASLTGWNECLSEKYSGTSSIAEVLGNCDKERLIIACRQVGSTKLTLAALGNRTDVIYDTGNDESGSHTAGGVQWYFSDSWSWGFAPVGATIIRNTCDGGDAIDENWNEFSDPNRLCWHTSEGSFSGGWRCGKTTGNDTLNSNEWERVIYQAD